VLLILYYSRVTTNLACRYPVVVILFPLKKVMVARAE